jgi:UDP-N-acetylglucosamine/UDP-N-acetylgalactosamine diphosphorylase
MVSFKGYDQLISKVYEFNQGHVFENWDRCSDTERKALLDDLSSVDFVSLNRLFASAGAVESVPLEFEPAPFVPVTSSEGSISSFRILGEDHIRKGRCAAFVVAGGQGSRLGFEGPKGAFAVSPVKRKTLFQIHAEKILKYSKKYHVSIPFLIMTSDVNHDQTLEYFEANNWFGLNRYDVIIFPQNMIPSLDTNGKLILSSKCSIFKNPDGHGGSLTALRTSGALAEIAKRGIDTVSYFQVDNPLVPIIDPVFIGRHLEAKAEVSSKIVPKAGPDEKVGVFVRFSNGRGGVVEYSDLPREKIEMRNADGSLSYTAANIAIHLFDCTFIERLTEGKDISLPYHVAKKKIKSYASGIFSDIDGFKFEKFVFDAIPAAERSLIVEVIREEEFAPVKNASGADSLETSQYLMSKLFRKWLMLRGFNIPPEVKVIEISPLTAVCPADIPSSIAIPSQEKVYI